MSVVTVSRQYGAGGLAVAPRIAEALGLRFVDRELAEEAARRLGADPDTARAGDERVPSLIEDIGLRLAATNAGLDAAPIPPIGGASLADAIRRVIVSLADAGGYVILGRGSQAILAGRPTACHLSLVADLRVRAERVARSHGIGEREAAATCERVDGERAAYVRRFHGRDIRDPLLYDAVINTTSLSVQDAAEIGVLVVRRKLAH